APRNGFPSSVRTMPLIDTDDDATSFAEVKRAETKTSKIRTKEIANGAQDCFRIVSPCGRTGPISRRVAAIVYGLHHAASTKRAPKEHFVPDDKVGKAAPVPSAKQLIQSEPREEGNMGTKEAVLSPSRQHRTTSPPKHLPTNQEIAERAYEIF